MNKYIANLVIADVNKISDFAVVKHHGHDGWLIYSTENIDPYLICFKNYLFEVCLNKDDELKEVATFTHLSEAVLFVRDNNA